MSDREAPRDGARTGAAATRERILDAASDLFYAQGIRATSADRIIEQAGITKVTFYRHFRSKTDLVVAYLERQAALERDSFLRAREHPDAAQALRSLAASIGAVSCQPGFRGCAFINAAAEIADSTDPVRAVVEQHRRWTREILTGIAAAAGVPDPDTTAGQLLMLRDGAMVAGYLGEPEDVARTFESACLAVIDAGLPGER